MKWTKEKCKEEALKYNCRNDFKNKNIGSYRASIKNKWIDEITTHMLIPYEKNKKWTKEKCQDEALKYNHRFNFKKGNGSAYNSAYFNNWLDDICSHMTEIYKPKNYWTKENCQKESLKYDYRIDFKLNSSVCYSKAIELKCLGEITSHMHSNNKQNNLTKEQCKEESLKYKTKTEFCKKSSSFYKKSLNNNWLDEICDHMIKLGDNFKRCIYVYEFGDNSAYIGLTYNLENRNYRHMNIQKNSSVIKHIKMTNLIPKLIQLTDYIFIEDAKLLEGKFVEEYRKNGWIILNKNKTGGIGGIKIKWNKEKCQEESLKYKTRSEFSKNNPSAYMSANRNNWLDEICIHMIKRNKK